MPSSDMTIREMAERLQADGLLDEEHLAAIAERLSKPAPRPGFPWFVRALIGIGAWVAAGFFLGFLSEADLIDWYTASLAVWGLAWIVGALVLRRVTRHEFFGQLSLAASVAGHVMTLVGVANAYDHDMWPVAAVAVLLCVAQYPLNRDSLHRFLSVVGTIGVVVGWLMGDDLHHLLHVVVLVEVAGVGAVFTAGRVRAGWRPLGFALATALPMTLLLTISGCEVATPGLLAAIGLIVLGYALGERVLLGLGVVFVPTFLIAYYYDLDVGLDIKSWTLMASGAVLLAARWVLSRRPWARGASA